MGATTVQLPFTRAEFFDLFAAYNAGLWPALVLLWVASALITVLLLSSRRPPDRWIAALLAAHWAWSAVACHAVFFTRINRAAWFFAALFLLDVRADYVLPIAGLALAIFTVQSGRDLGPREGVRRAEDPGP